MPLAPMAIAEVETLDRFALGHASGGDWSPAVAECVAKLGPLPPTANIGFVYFTENFAAKADQIVAALKQQTGIKSWGWYSRCRNLGDRAGILRRAWNCGDDRRFPARFFQRFRGR